MTRAVDTAIGVVFCAVFAAIFIFAWTSIEGDPAPVTLPWRAP